MASEEGPVRTLLSTSRAYAFDDPREARIYERLSRIGPGPAAFWRDACFLTRNPTVVITSVHMIGHALREVESAVRHILKVTLGTDGSGHVGQIEEILRALDIPLEEPAAQAWLGTPGNPGLDRWAHRSHLNFREPDEQFRTLWSDVLTFLDAALEAFDSASVRALDSLDNLLSVDPPVAAQVSAFLQDLPKSVVVLDQFAENAPPSWLKPLRDSGYLRDVPETSGLGEGDATDQLRWPLSRYLLRVAQIEEYRSSAVEAALEIADRANPYLHVDLVDIALVADPEFAARFVPSVRGWLDLNASFLLVDHLTKLAEKLLAAGQEEAGFALVELLTELETTTNE